MNSKTLQKQSPKISVVTVVYNSRDFLEITLQSVINQSYQNIEFIIIDGGSTDGTVDVIKRYQQNISYWISEKDSGIYDAMNKALKVVTGEWVYFLGAGDLLLNVLDKVVIGFKDPNTVYYGDVYRTDLLQTFDGKFNVFKAARVCICHQAIFYPADAIKKYGFNTHYKVQADHNLNMQIQGDGNYRFEYFKTIVCIYSGDGFSAITRDEEFFKDRLSIVKKNFSYIVYLYAFWYDKAMQLIKRGEYRARS